MVSDVDVYISMKDRGDRRLIVDGSMAMVIDILRELGREALAEREQRAASPAQQQATDANEPPTNSDSPTDVG